VNRSVGEAYSIKRRATFPVGSALSQFTIQRRIAVVGNGNIDVGNTSAPRKSGQQMAGAMSQQGAPIMGDNQCSPQKFVQLVGCRDPKARDLKLGDTRIRTGSEGRPYPNPVKR
jgi:polygalacturonase